MCPPAPKEPVKALYRLFGTSGQNRETAIGLGTFCLLPSLTHILMAKDIISPLCILTLAIPFAATLLLQEGGTEQQKSIIVTGNQFGLAAYQHASPLRSGSPRQSDHETCTGDCARSVHDILGKQASPQSVDNLTADRQTKAGMLPEILSLRPL